MHFRYQRSYRGPVQAVIFDWAGTTVDFGSLAPVAAFVQLFQANDIVITLDEARLPMGTEKREHIRRLCTLPEVTARWREQYGTEPDGTAIERLYRQFIPLQSEVIHQFAELIPGCLETVMALRQRGIKIGANTGYSREMLDPLARVAAEQGYLPDSSVCATEVPRGRPWPCMSLKNLIELEIETVHAGVKVDDTLPGIEEGLNAGLWTVAVAVSGNEVGLALSDWKALDEVSRNTLRRRAYRRLYGAGAHYVIDSVADLFLCIQDIERRLRCGETP
ncbi:MAG: phosphonoacetaldehyde hydrolase [Candidatus Competibacteraceae bacterium]